MAMPLEARPAMRRGGDPADDAGSPAGHAAETGAGGGAPASPEAEAGTGASAAPGTPGLPPEQRREESGDPAGSGPEPDVAGAGNDTGG